MNTAAFHKAKRLALITSVLIVLYLAGAILLITGWFGVQSLDPAVWRTESLPLYAVTFLIGAISGFGVLRWKRWGVYGLVGTWVLTGILNVAFPVETTTSYHVLNAGIWLIVGFFLALLPVWQELE